MIKKLVKIVLSILFIFTICLLYLSYYGIETKRFNQLIKDKITKINHATNIDLKVVKIILNLSNFSIGLKTYDSNLTFDNKTIKDITISEFKRISLFRNLTLVS